MQGETPDARGDEGGREGRQGGVRVGRRPGGSRRGERDGRVESARRSARRLGRRLRGGVPRHDGWCSARGKRHVRPTGRRATRALPLPPLHVATGHAVSATSATSPRPCDASTRYDARVRVPARARVPPRSREKPPRTPVSSFSHAITEPDHFATARNASRRPSKPRQLPKTPPRAIASSCARFACKVTDLLPSLAIATGETSPPRQRVGPSSTRSPPRPPAGERTPLALTWTHP